MCCTLFGDARTLKRSLNGVFLVQEKKRNLLKLTNVTVAGKCFTWNCVIMVRVLLLMRGLLINIQAFMFPLNKGKESKAPEPLCRLSWLPWVQSIYKWNICGDIFSKRTECTFPGRQSLVKMMWFILLSVPTVGMVASLWTQDGVSTGSIALHCQHVSLLCDWLLKWVINETYRQSRKKYNL